MFKHLILLAAAALCAQPAFATTAKLGVGDPAPKIDVSKWVKGDAVPSFEKNRIYVVEFWATWCGPCRVSIPHLTEMQKKNKDVTFIGVSVWENDTNGVAPFVDKMGDKMGYRVAMDDVPSGGSGQEGAMAKTWMAAASQPGIPTAFVVNKEGRIAWIGHPMNLEAPLAKIVAGTWDIEKFAKVQAAEPEITKALKSKDFKAALAAIDRVVALDASMESKYGPMKFKLLLADKNYADAYAYGETLVNGGAFKELPANEAADALNGIAWTIVDPKSTNLEKRDLALAMKAALRANELTQGKNPAILDTLAKVHFDSGDVAKAIEVQQKAVDLADDPDMKEELSQRLEQYKKASKPKG
jgi:thiol-disulfide isomerase/thioredoxin